MNLNDFENKIDSTILNRGYDYFLNQAVVDLEEVAIDTWVSLVEGTDDYAVMIKLKDDNIKKWQCNCPYDYGDTCKHVVATLYALADELDISSEAKSNPNNKKTSPKKATKKKTQKNDISEIFSQASQQELQEFLQNQFPFNRGMKNTFIAHFAEYLDEDINQKYQIIVRNIYKAAKGRQGFIDYRSTYKLAQPLNDLLDKASDLASDKKIISALSICKAIIEQVPKFVHYMDDSDGSAGGLFEYAFELFYEISTQVHPELKDELFSYCLKEFPKDKYSDFGFEKYFLEVLPVLMTTQQQEKRFFKLIDKQLIKVTSKINPNYDIVQLIQVKLDYLLLKDRNDEVDVLVNENKQYPQFRKILLQQALNQKKFKQAKQLCEQGIIIAKNERHAGTVGDWREQLLKIAELEKNKSELRKWAEVLYNNSYRNMTYYKKLKSTYTKQAWAVKCEAIIDKIKGKNQFGGYGVAEELADVFVIEKYFDRLLVLLQINPQAIELIDSYARHLIKDYPQEIVDLYISGIKRQAEQTGRAVYNKTVKYMKAMSSIQGSQLRLNELVQCFKLQYKNRKAMMEILNKGFPKQFNFNP